MIGTALCLSIALQPLPAHSAAWALDTDAVRALRQALDEFGDFQQPYAAPMGRADREAGAVDATVESASACLAHGPAAILLEDDGIDDAARPNRCLVTGTVEEGRPGSLPR